MMGFTDQKRWVATEEDCKRSWSGAENGANFRCYLCGHKFLAGDGCRWVYSSARGFVDSDDKRWGVINFMTCDTCDGEDVLDRWIQRNEEFNSARFWALR